MLISHAARRVRCVLTLLAFSCDGCKFIFPQSEVNQSPSLDLAVCNDCERKFNQTGLAERAAREEEVRPETGSICLRLLTECNRFIADAVRPGYEEVEAGRTEEEEAACGGASLAPYESGGVRLSLSAPVASQPVHIDLLTDGDDDADAEDKPVAETVRSTRPVRAAAAAAQSLSQRLAGMKGLRLTCIAAARCLR